MTYSSLLEAYGWDRFADDAEAGRRDEPDRAPTSPRASAPDSRRVQLVAPSSTDERIRLAADSTDGWLYLVTLTGTTGSRDDLSPALAGLVDACPRGHRRPRCSPGSGSPRPTTAGPRPTVVDGVVVGSRAVEVAENGPKRSVDTSRLCGPARRLDCEPARPGTTWTQSDATVLIDARNVQRSQWPNMPDDELVDRSRTGPRNTTTGSCSSSTGKRPAASWARPRLDGRTTLVGSGSESADEWLIREAPHYRHPARHRSRAPRNTPEARPSASSAAAASSASSRRMQAAGGGPLPQAPRHGGGLGGSSRPLDTAAPPLRLLRRRRAGQGRDAGGRHWRLATASPAPLAASGAVFGVVFDELRRRVTREPAPARREWGYGACRGTCRSTRSATSSTGTHPARGGSRACRRCWESPGGVRPGRLGGTPSSRTVIGGAFRRLAGAGGVRTPRRR